MELSRRRFLVFIGAAGGTAALDLNAPGLITRAAAAPTAAPSFGNPGGGFLAAGTVTPVRLPHQLEAYNKGQAFLPTGIGSGIAGKYGGAQVSYTVYDDLVVPPEFERYVFLKWGDHVFPDAAEYFGYNADYTAFVPIAGSTSDGYLWTNHEYVSSPMSFGAPEAPALLASAVPKIADSAVTVLGVDLDGPAVTQLYRWGEYCYNIGGSVVHITKDAGGRFAPVADAINRRYHLLSGLGLNAGRTDARADGTLYSAVTSWGAASYQNGDGNYLVGTGPASADVFPLSTDGLGNKIIGTGFNCSGGYTPWGTILTCEENFQGTTGAFFCGVQEDVKPDGTQTAYGVGGSPTFTDARSGQTFLNHTTGTFFGQVGEKYGYVVEIDPRDPSYRARKHTALGRFRHENVALRAEPGSKLVAYMGDDRRGGHTWKYVSNGLVKGPGKRDANSALFEDGQLYVAKYDAAGTGSWIPFSLSTPVNPSLVSDLVSGEATARGVAPSTITNALMKLPKRNGVAGQTTDGGAFSITVTNEGTSIPSYLNKGGAVSGTATLGDYYTSLGAALCDAFLAANLIGGTPTARPEDFEVKPGNGRNIFLAYTDGAPGSDGYPDSRIFTVGKYGAAVSFEQPSGGIYKIKEDSVDGAGTTFTWLRYDQGGEDGAVNGSGFATIDNLVFDQDKNLWGVIDMTTAAHNGFNLTYAGATLQPGQTTIDHTQTGNFGNVFGVYGNNWMLYVPTTGLNAGRVMPFAYGPVRCEMTGPTFVGDTLIVSVQHPGEDSPINGDANAGGTAASVLTRTVQILNLDGTTFNQSRSLPRGSNWPSNIPVADGGAGDPNGPPRPSVVGIRRKPTS